LYIDNLYFILITLNENIGGSIVKKGIRVLIKVFVVIFAVAALLFISYEVYMSKEVIGEPVEYVWQESDTFDPTSVSQLVKKDGEDFQILLFSDIQLAGNPFGDPGALSHVDDLVNEVQPDFIMTTGDNTAWLFSDVVVEKLISQMETYEIPWGVTLGNHDSEGRADREWYGNQYADAKFSVFEAGPSNIHGIGNYVVNVVDENSEPVYALIMLDSNTTRKYDDGVDYDYIYDDQIAWYKWAALGQPDVPSMLFFHIPLPEFDEAITQWRAGELDGFGEINEAVCDAPVNTGLFDTAKELGSTTHIFVGHDHVNCLSVEYEGIRLTYGLKTGPTSYYNKDLQGATLITIKDGTNEVIVEYLYR
jgi:hypothetical protein